MGLYRDAEGQFQSAMRSTKLPRSFQKSGPSEFFQCVEMYLYLCKVYIKLDQPLKAIEYYKKVRIDKWTNRWIDEWMDR